MQTSRYYPAPNRDLANVPHYLPPDSLEASPWMRTAFGTIAVAIGTIVLFSKLIGAWSDTSAGPMQQTDHSILVSDWLAVAASGCFLICGFLLFRKAIIAPSILLAVGLILAVVSRWIL